MRSTTPSACRSLSPRRFTTNHCPSGAMGNDSGRMSQNDVWHDTIARTIVSSIDCRGADQASKEEQGSVDEPRKQNGRDSRAWV